MNDRAVSRLVLITMTVAFFSPLVAQTPTAPVVDATVSCIVSAGYWQDTEAHGHYRVVVADSGFEHVISTVSLEWIAETDDGNQVRSRAPIVEINTHVGLSVGCPAFTNSNGATEFRFEAVETHQPSNRHVLRLRPGAPGKYEWESEPQ